MPCCSSKTKISRGCCVPSSKKTPCKLVKKYEYKCVPCKVKSTPGKCQSKCTFTFKRVKILKEICRVPCKEACSSPCTPVTISPLTCC